MDENVVKDAEWMGNGRDGLKFVCGWSDGWPAQAAGYL